MVRGVEKRFGATAALAGVDLTVRPGSVHALLGENGAGKSTLMQIVAGLRLPDRGSMVLDGKEYRPRDPRAARRAGIGMVHQHFTTIPALTVWENIALAAEWPLAGARGRAAALLADRGLTLGADRLAGDLSVGLRQQLELQKALAGRPRLLLLDEPTGVLTAPEVEDLFRVIRTFVAGGGAVVLITHKLDEALTHADAITVLRRGHVTLDRGSGEEPRPSRTEILQAMLGRDDDSIVRARAPRPGAVVAAAGGLEVHAGEVVGIAGIEGNGQRELLRAFRAPAFIPEDRTTEGLIPSFSLTENLALRPAEHRWRLDWGALERRMRALITERGITATGPGALAGSLSGGNQQKVVVARALEGSPRLVVAENPARGLDVSAAEEVFGRLRAAAADGAGVLFYSTDLDEVVAWADRVLVIAGGRLREPPPGADRSEIGALMVTAGEGG